jgi:hypothetical protein
MANMQELEHSDPVPVVSVFNLSRWPASIATAWVLSRNQNFTQACARRGGRADAHTVQLDAEEWRRASFRRPEYNPACRGPVMLFPSALAAWERLRREFGPDSADYARAEVMARFPALDFPDRPRLMQSLWRADDPNHSLPLSHAAWWIASKRGTTPVVLDDWKIWKAAFETFRRHLVAGRIPIFDGDGSCVPPRIFAVVSYDYPCSALSPSPFVPGRHTHVACRLDAVQGDQFFESGSAEAKWSTLHLSPAEFIRVAFEGDDAHGAAAAPHRPPIAGKHAANWRQAMTRRCESIGLVV